MRGRQRLSREEEQKIAAHADIYAILVASEALEKAFIRELYTPACLNLLAQYKTASALAKDKFNLQEFVQTYSMNVPAAAKRMEIGVPATFEHNASGGSGGGSGGESSAKHVADTVQLLITLMDSLKLSLVSVDQIHPLLSDLIQSLNKVSTLPADFVGREKIKTWLIKLNHMRAADELTPDESRQLLFDLESAHAEFHRTLG
ncbi:MAG: hypothetical protein SGCHY_000919 [Lobulomycetales sp.]